MPTKPEGPAQEPQRDSCVHCGLRIYKMTDGMFADQWAHHGSNYRHCHSTNNAEDIATPAPSQPAGAREFAAIHLVSEAFSAFLEMTDGKPELDTRWMREAEELLCGGSPPAQQTAAKDAALVAAERERDSLREQLRAAEEAFDRMATCEDDESEEFVTAWDALGAALKAGKDGQQ